MDPTSTHAMAAPAAPAENEGTAQEARITRAGRKIIYKTTVLQHPEKARACGQGAKSSTDRRPVDPPPIIDLHIFEQEADGTEKDVTYSYRANFFMYASLEVVKNIGQGRLPKDPASGPLLCGSPVSGISYLDRPNPAGYFIFPDLSIRHEGRYRLCFTLYEELRDPSMGDREANETAMQSPLEHVNGRCVVRTKPFTVFSAKKFPGLSESTILSRTVAEQGCRVRIRRDIRMRRRNNGKKDEWDDEEDDEPDTHQMPQPATPELHHAAHSKMEPLSRHESISSASFQPPSMQRTSAPDLHSQYQAFQQTIPPPVPHNTYPPPQQHVQQPMSQQYQPTPGPQYLQQSVAQSPQQLHHFQQPSQYGYSSQQYYPYTQHYGYMQPQTQPQQTQQMHSPAYNQPPSSHLRHDSATYATSPQEYHSNPNAPHYATQNTAAPLGPLESGHSRSSSLLPIQSTNVPSGLTQTPTANSTPALTNHSQAFLGNSLPPIQNHHHHQYSATSHQTYDHAPSLPSHTYHPPPVSYAPVQTDTYQPPPPQYLSGIPAGAPKPKRSFASTFNTQHVDQRLQHGARPNPSENHGVSLLREETDSDDDEPQLMEYKRADGRIMTRPWPTLRA